MFPLGGDQACDINFLLFTTEGENVQDISAQWRFCLKAWMLIKLLYNSYSNCWVFQSGSGKEALLDKA